MRNIADMVTSTKPIAKITPVRQTSSSLNEETKKLFNALFIQLKATFPAALSQIRSQDDLNELRRQWVLAFIENGVRTIEQIERGMAVARQQETPFLPSPGQFVAWCQSGDAQLFGLPESDGLYDAVMVYAGKRLDYGSPENYPWESNAEYWLVTKVYSEMIKQNLSSAGVRERCEKELLATVKRLKEGFVFPKPVPQIERKYTPVSKEKALSYLSQIKQKLAKV